VAIRPLGIPAFKIGVNGSVRPRDQHPTWLASPRAGVVMAALKLAAKFST
jgi:hypothetical protein